MIKWSWYVESDNKCWDDVFDTPDQALEAMGRRMGDAPDEKLIKKMANCGIYIATVRVSITPIMILREHEAVRQ